MKPTRQLEVIAGLLGIFGLSSVYIFWALPSVDEFALVVGVFSLFVSNRAFAKAAVYSHLEHEA